MLLRRLQRAAIPTRKTRKREVAERRGRPRPAPSCTLQSPLDEESLEPEQPLPESLDESVPDPPHPSLESELLESLPSLLLLESPPQPSDESEESPPHPSVESAATVAAPTPAWTAAPLLVPSLGGDAPLLPPPVPCCCGGGAGTSHVCA